MKVRAKDGTRCPKENSPREYISDSGAENVPDTTYYLRLVADGSLVEVLEPEVESRAIEPQAKAVPEIEIPHSAIRNPNPQKRGGKS